MKLFSLASAALLVLSSANGAGAFEFASPKATPNIIQIRNDHNKGDQNPLSAAHCSNDAAPVCGKVSGKATTFPTECGAQQAGAEIAHTGKCTAADK